MKTQVFFLFLVCSLFNLYSFGQDTLALHTYGQSYNPAVIFLHGGPGYNAVSFELTTAQPLAQKGFYVISFDQPGSGRSTSVQREQTFEASNQTILSTLNKLNLDKATLIGHSFGGILAAQFAKSFPNKVTALYLVSTPLDFPEVFTSILNKCQVKYTLQNKTEQLKYLEQLEKMDRSTLQFSSYCFYHAMQCGLYQTNVPTSEAQSLYTSLLHSSEAPYLSKMEQGPVQGFYKNEHYTTQNFTPLLSTLDKSIPIKALLGSEDGLFNSTQINRLKKVLGKENVTIFENASHNLFIDQQKAFLNTIQKQQ